MAAPENKPFEVALSYYDQLLPVIPVDEVLVKLIPTRIINLDDKQLIKAEKTSKKQAEYLLDHYILKRIQTGEDHILFILLEAMRESGKCDSLVKKIYKDLGMDLSQCTRMCVRVCVCSVYLYSMCMCLCSGCVFVCVMGVCVC